MYLRSILVFQQRKALQNIFFDCVCLITVWLLNIFKKQMSPLLVSHAVSTISRNQGEQNFNQLQVLLCALDIPLNVVKKLILDSNDFSLLQNNLLTHKQILESEIIF